MNLKSFQVLDQSTITACFHHSSSVIYKGNINYSFIKGVLGGLELLNIVSFEIKVNQFKIICAHSLWILRKKSYS